MLEALLVGVGEKSYFLPDSGPGPKWLVKGTPDLGYFGEVPSTDFFTRAEVQNGTDLTTGTLLNDVAKWIKVIVDGKVLFIPYKGALSRGYSWEKIYSVGAALGNDEIGNYPIGAGVKQDCKLFKYGQLFRVRLPKVSNTEGVLSYTDTDILNAGEHVKIMASLTTGVFDKWTGPKWNLYSPADVLGSSWVITQNTWTRSTSNRVAVLGAAFDTIEKTNTTINWLPILELYVNPDFIIPAVVTGPGYDEVNALIGLPGTSTTLDTNHLKPIRHATTIAQTTALTDVVLTSFSGTPLAVTPISVASITQPGLLPIASVTTTLIN